MTEPINRPFCCLVYPQIYEATLCKWNKKLLQVYVRSERTNLSREEVDEAFAEAVQWWSDVVELDFEFVDQQSGAEIVIDSARIDGGGGTLAWSHPPDRDWETLVRSDLT